MTALLDHLWQSSLFALAAGLLTLAVRRNAARIRFWLWFAASLKFLVPFALLAMLGEKLARLAPPPIASAIIPSSLRVLAGPAEKFSAPAQALASQPGESLVVPLLLIWLLGFAVMAGVRLSRWLKLRALVREAHALPLPAPVEVRASHSLLEPGLVGILRPVVLFPKGLLSTLSTAERDGILAHEITHLRRRDNLTAALHMAVEMLFWFWPAVWFIGARLIAERERACDEGVIAAGHDPEAYAGGILKVCRFCIRSPLACVPGVSGANLSLRIRQIMAEQETVGLDGGRRVLLAGAALLAVALPVIGGLMTTPLAVTVTRQVVAVQMRAQEAVTAVAEQIGVAPTRIKARPLPNFSRKIVAAMPALPAALPVETTQPAVVLAPAAAPAPAPVPQLQPVAVAAPVSSPPVQQIVMVLDPRGEGDPDAVTCRVPQTLPGSRLAGPEVCQTNRIWAALYKDGRRLAPDGRSLIATNVHYGREAMTCPPSLILSASPGMAWNNPILTACR
jgi:beta-lactamase regulating signal transducer with metallopeptidase domain